jgi:RNA polymerase sigma-70 factor (ECF subfamily)
MEDAKALVEQYHAVVFRYLCRLAGNREDARDLTQDVFVRAFRALAAKRGSERPLPWLLRIARNRWIDHIRTRRVRGRSVDAGEAGGCSGGQLLNATLHQALKDLDPLDCDVFLLREVAGLGYVEIGAVCDLSPDAVRSRIHRARRALRERLSHLHDRSLV